MYSDQTLSGSEITVTIDERIGSGPHWETFRGRTGSGELVAVRGLQRPMPSDAYDRFESLAAQWHSVSDQANVRTLLDWGTDPNPWVAVDYAPGELESYATGSSIEAAVECDLATRADLLRDVCDAIRTYGRYGSTRSHLAVGPESVSFRDGPNGPTAVVGDWGISRLVIDPPTTPYTAPEQLAVDESDGPAHAGQATDVYRIGALGHHLFGGVPPFSEDDPSIADRIRRGIAEEAGFDNVATEFVSALRRSTARDPADRHEGVYQLGRDISTAAPRVPSSERSAESLPPPGGESKQASSTSADAPAVETEAPSDESDTDTTSDEGKRTDDDPTQDDESTEDDGSVASNGAAGTDDTDDRATDTDTSIEAGTSGDTAVSSSSGGRTLRTGLVAQVALVALVALIVLVAGAWGAMSLGLIGGDDPEAELVTVSGTVYADAAGEVPAEEMSVTLDPLDAPPEGEDAEGPVRQEVTTDADGAFTVENVSTGNYSVWVDDANGLEYDDHAVEVTEDAAEIEITPDRAFISGQVVDAVTGEPISTDGDGEVDATIELVSTNGGSSVVDATEGGSYGFVLEDDAIDGEYEIWADAVGYEPANLTVDRFGEQDAIEPDPVTMSLSGQVTDSSVGAPIENANVTVSTDAGQEFIATTDPGGDYETEAEIPIGEHDVEIEADGYVTATETVEFETDDVTARFELDAEASIEGVGEGADGIPQRFEIELTQGEGEDETVVQETTSDSDTGEYSIEGLKPGDYTLTAERAGISDSADLILGVGDTAEVNIEIDGEIISVNVVP